MRYAMVNSDGIVVNVIEAEPGFTLAMSGANAVPDPAGVSDIGMTYTGTFSNPAAEEEEDGDSIPEPLAGGSDSLQTSPSGETLSSQAKEVSQSGDQGGGTPPRNDDADNASADAGAGNA